jgi:uncharacterized protein (TIGR03437 family)
MKNRPVRLLLLLSASLTPAFAQNTWDNSGNGMLNGSYYFRQIVYVLDANSGNLVDALSFYGNINFNGTGSYTTSNTQLIDLAQGTVSAPTPTGTYSVAASGQVFFTNPVVPKDTISGLVSQGGILIGAATENTSLYNDLFIAAPLVQPFLTASSFRGSYTMAYIEEATQGVGALATINPDGNSSLGTVGVNGYAEGGGTSKITQSLTGVSYIFSSGAAKVTFPARTNAFFSDPRTTTQYYLYFSPDGNFFFGGGQFAADMIVGVRTGTGTPALNGLFYEAGFDDNPEAFYGSFSAGNGVILGHQRLLNFFNPTSSFSYTYNDAYNLGTTGAYNNGLTNYVVGANNIRIGSGIGPNLSISVALPAPSLDPTKISSSGVFLNPTGIVNAGSSAPFTAPIAPGELLTLYGSNLAAGPQVASSIPFPTTLNNVQVMVDGIAAPIYYVTPGQLSAIVPYAVTSGIATVQVINNGKSSNVVTMQVAKTAPGVLTQSQNGLGYGDVIHPDGTLVNDKNPAKPGETVSVFLTGLGGVSPAISDGGAGPTGPYSLATNTITAFVGGVQAQVGYAGLAPTFAGLYQLNITIPATGVTAGDNYLDVSGPDAYTSESLIAVAASASAAPQQSQAMRRRPTGERHLTPLTNRVIR